MAQEFWIPFFGAFGGVATAVVIVKFLAARFVEHQLAKVLVQHKHQLDIQLATLQGGMSRLGDILSRRNEREFAATEKAWELMIRALGLTQGRFSSLREGFDLRVRNQRDIDHIIENVPFPAPHKQALKEATGEEQAVLFDIYSLQQDVTAALDAWRECKNWLTTHEIFLNDEIYAGVMGVLDELLEVLSLARAYAGEKTLIPAARYSEFEKRLDDATKRSDDLAKRIRARFGFGDPDGRQRRRRLTITLQRTRAASPFS